MRSFEASRTFIFSNASGCLLTVFDSNVKNKLNFIVMETYKVYKVFRISGRKQILKTNLTREDAQRLVQSYPNSNQSMVCFTKQN